MMKNYSVNEYISSAGTLFRVIKSNNVADLALYNGEGTKAYISAFIIYERCANMRMCYGYENGQTISNVFDSSIYNTISSTKLLFSGKYACMFHRCLKTILMYSITLF
jgi:hypothetical protein